MKTSVFSIVVSFFFFAVALVQALPTPQLLGGGNGDLVSGAVDTANGLVGGVVGTAGGIVGGVGKAITEYCILV
jgi:hypothetical protein